MAIFLAAHTTYSEIILGLYNNYICLDKIHESNKLSSKNFILILDILLKRNNINLSELDFIAVNQGPGPFTTLRVSLASVNGLGFAAKIVLVGVDGLEAFLQQEKDNNYFYTIALLNAFGNDVYIGIYNSKVNNIIYKGCKNINLFLEEFSKNKQATKIVGNGAILHESAIKNSLENYVYIPENNPEVCSLDFIAKLALDNWQQNNDPVYKLLPLYLKDYPAQNIFNNI